MKMQNAEMEFVTFDTQDVIATSGPNDILVELSGFYDGNKHNATIKYNSQTIYNAANYSYGWGDFMASALNGIDGVSGVTTQTRFYYNSYNGNTAIQSLTGTAGDGSYYDEWDMSCYNGIFKWLAEESRFKKIQ